MIRDIETLRSSLSLDMIEAATRTMTDEESKSLFGHVGWLVQELQQLNKRLGVLEANVCYHNGTAYSPGAVVDGKTCQSDGTWF